MRMKTSSTAAAPKRSTARSCLIINQFATPGLGSLMARRYVAGTVQLLLAVVGFCLVVGWFIEVMVRTYRLVSGLPPATEHFPWMGKVGALIFFLSWLLAWPTTISVMREAREAEPELPPARPLPPIIEP
jgi:hypothetical protein